MGEGIYWKLKIKQDGSKLGIGSKWVKGAVGADSGGFSKPCLDRLAQQRDDAPDISLSGLIARNGVKLARSFHDLL